MRVTSSFLKTGQSLAISAFSSSFGSDPDLFISTNFFPNNITNAKWHSEQSGSDTIIIPSGQFKVGDNISILVTCQQACNFDIRSYYVSNQILQEGLRSQYQWNGTSTTILTYYVKPTTSSGLTTQQWQIDIQPTGSFNSIQSYFSYNQNLTNLKQPKFQIYGNGISVRKTSAEQDWCTSCYVYLVVNTLGAQDVYVTGVSASQNSFLSTSLPNEVIINKNQIECYPYSVLNSGTDILFTVQNYQGNINLFVSTVIQPASLSSSYVKLTGKQLSANHVVILKSADRAYWGSTVGTYYLCGLAYMDSSAQLIVQQANFGNTYQVQNGQLFTYQLLQNTSSIFSYGSQDLLSQSVKINLSLGLYDQTGAATNMTLVYQLCNSSACSDGVAIQTKKIYGVQGVQSGQILFSAQIDHDPQVCAGSSTCYYLYTVSNNNNVRTPITYTFQLAYTSTQWTQIGVGQTVQAQLSMSSSVNYQILQSQTYLTNIQSLTISVQNFQGDVDLAVNTSQRTQQSQSQLQFDQVVLSRDSGDLFNSNIFITLFANSQSQYQLTVTATYLPSADTRLVSATPLVERQAQFLNLTGSSAEYFLSYRPWWSAHENLTLCFVSDNLLSSTYFYADLDKYPISTSTNLIDLNDLLIINSTDPKYAVGQGGYGSYYLRVRQNFTSISSLIQNTNAYVNFYAFAQAPLGQYQDLYANQVLIGVAQSQTPTYYRHFLMSSNQTINITLSGMFNKGFPYLMAGVSDQKVALIDFSMPQTYQWIKQISQTTRSTSLIISGSDRTNVQSACSNAGYNRNGGNQACGIYIAVQCQPSDIVCSYQLSLSVNETLISWYKTLQNTTTSNTTNGSSSVNCTKINSTTKANSTNCTSSNSSTNGSSAANYTYSYNQTFNVVKQMPRYIPWDSEYLNGALLFNTSQSYYIPIDPLTLGDFAILVNKTSLQQTNGDVGIGMIIQGGSGNVDYKNWTLPTKNSSMAYSQNNQSSQPEIIESCNKTISSWCNYLNKGQCSLIFTVYGLTPSVTSFFRIRIFNGTNKLFPSVPISGQTTLVGETDYYWFVSTAAINSTNWHYDIGLGIKTQGDDADLLVSVMDGRFPTENDFDYKSDKQGADYVRIASSDAIFKQNSNGFSWNPKVGVLVVVGVKARTANLSYTLTLQGPSLISIPASLNRTDITTNQELSFVVPASNSSNSTGATQSVYLYRWFNWQSTNFNLRVSQSNGSATFYLNSVSEETLDQNIFADIPLASQNSFWSANLLAGNVSNFSIYRSNVTTYPNFCYNCWYYLTAVVQKSQVSVFKVLFSQIPDAGTNFLQLAINQPTQILNTSLGSWRWVKFLLDSKDTFSVQIAISSGRVSVGVGLDLTTIMTSPLWTINNATVGTQQIQIQTNDPNFHLGTFYYAFIYSSTTSSTSMFSVNQARTVGLLPNSIPLKFQFPVTQQQVMFFVFQIPVSNSLTHQVLIQMQTLTGNFYPSVYLNQVQMNSMPTDFTSLNYPTIVNYNLKFDNGLSVYLNASQTISYNGTCSMQFCFYAMTVYQNSYGLDDVRKPEFLLNVTAWQYNNKTSLTTSLVNQQLDQTVPLIQKLLKKTDSIISYIFQ